MSVKRLISLWHVNQHSIVSLFRLTCSAWSYGSLRPGYQIHHRFYLQTSASPGRPIPPHDWAVRYPVDAPQRRFHTQMRQNSEESQTTRLRSSWTLHQRCLDITWCVKTFRACMSSSFTIKPRCLWEKQTTSCRMSRWVIHCRCVQVWWRHTPPVTSTWRHNFTPEGPHLSTLPRNVRRSERRSQGTKRPQGDAALHSYACASTVETASVAGSPRFRSSVNDHETSSNHLLRQKGNNY